MRNPNGYGCVVNLGKKRRKPYAVRLSAGYRDDGTRIYKYLSYHTTKTAAKNALAKHNINKMNTLNIDITFSQMFDEWYLDKEKTVESEKTLEWYRIVKKKISPILDMAIKDVKLIDLQMIADKESPDTQRRIKSVCRQIFNKAIANDIAHKNYADYLVLKNPKKSNKHKPFTESDINTLWSNLSLYFADIVLIMIYSGLRPNEICKLENENIYLEDNYFIVGSKTTAGKDRYIPINSKIKELIKNRVNEKKYFLNEESIYKFKDYHMKNRFKKVMNELELEYTPYDCRHTFISMMKKADADALYLKRIVGHADKNVTDKVYTHTDIEQLQSIINLI